MKAVRIALALFATISLTAECHALQLGDPAPPLQIANWIKGDAVASLSDSKTVYVVEFWATWCPPCRKSIPYLTELQKKYKDRGVVVIGISDEEEDAIRGFVTTMGEKMDYRVARDDGRKTWDAYAKPFGITAVPQAFIVGRDGKLLWKGHPMDGLEETVERILAGGYDVGQAVQAASDRRLKDEMRELQSLWAQEYTVLAKYGRDKAGADQLGEKLLGDPKIEARLLAALAWTILDSEDLAYRNLAFAVRAAQKGVELSASKDPAVLDVYARALFETGKIDEAKETERKAIDMCPDAKMKSVLQEHLDKYENKPAQEDQSVEIPFDGKTPAGPAPGVGQQ